VPGTCNSGTGTCSTPLASGASCTTGQACYAWYPDCDGDGYGSSSAAAVYSCIAPTGGASCPSYVMNKLDCCDSDTNAHPGQTSYFTTPDACGSTTQSATPYDYNCNGTDDQGSNGPTDCLNGGCAVSGTTCVVSSPLPADCNGMQVDDNLAACGATWYVDVISCSYVGPPAGPECLAIGNGGPGGTQACH
jgi:hypothetical protein